jgi:hypothetical protein
MTGHRIVQKLFSGVLWRAVFQGYVSSLHRAAAAEDVARVVAALLLNPPKAGQVYGDRSAGA